MVHSCPVINRKAYALIYLLETQLRALVIKKLKKKSAVLKSGGWLKYIPQKILNDCQRRSELDRSSYQDLGSNQLIDYSNLTDLAKICNCNADTFSDSFGNLQFIDIKLKEIDKIRNTVAHSRNLSGKEFSRLKIAYRDIMFYIKRQ